MKPQLALTIDPETIVDLTYPVRSGMPVSSRERPVLVERRMTHQEHGVCASSIEMGSHAGTHIDAPFHFHPDGITVERLPLASLLTSGCVLDLRLAPKGIDAGSLRLAAAPWGNLQPGTAVVLWTGWDRFFGHTEMHDHPYLTEEGAQFLVGNGITVVGIDAIGVDDSLGSRFPAHQLLLGNGVPIVENLCGLETWAPPCRLAFIPCCSTGADAAPVRAFGWRSARSLSARSGEAEIRVPPVACV